MDVLLMILIGSLLEKKTLKDVLLSRLSNAKPT